MSRVLLPRPGDNGSMIAIRTALVTSWAPSTERDSANYTDIWCGGRKITVAMPFAEVDKRLLFELTKPNRIKIVEPES